LAAVLGMIPVFGVGWVGMLYYPAALVLVGVRPPWSLLLFAALVGTPAPVCFALGHPEWAVYFTVGTLIFPVPLAVMMLLIRATRQLQDARLALAEQAVVRERLRIDQEVRESVGAGLAAIATQGQHTGEVAAQDPGAAVQELRGLVDDARRTLAETRRIVTRYREVSLLAELRTIVALLLAAGIETRLELPPDLPEALDEQARVSLRRDVARLLEETAPLATVAIAVTPCDGQLRFDLRTGPGPAAARIAAG
jgi:signal transduction histidine kinase